MKITESTRLRLGLFELNLRTGEVCSVGENSDGKKVLLQDQPFRVLRILIDCGGEIATREEIKRKLWPNDTIVDFDHSINVAIATLRRVFGDSAVECRYIQTIPRRGYRLMVPVERVGPLEVPVQDEPGSHLLKDGSARNAGFIGRKISHFRALEVIGGGGMGVVYKAEDLKLDRLVALKFLPEELAGDPVFLKRFEREARAASSLNHPNICTIHEIGEHEGQPFIAMEFLEGHSLRDRLALADGKPLPLPELLRISSQICDGLQAAHDKRIVHRDIKPANIFLTGHGQVKILDFGLAKLVETVDSEEIDGEGKGQQTLPDLATSRSIPAGESTLTLHGIQMGTASYMSPEQIRNEELDSRSDLFSFGLVLYEMATGYRAFEGDSVQEVHQAILHFPPGSTRETKATLSRRLDTVISRALEKDRARRYQSAGEMRRDLSQTRDPLPRAFYWRRKWLAVAASLLIIFAAGTLYWRVRSAVTLAPSDTLVLADMENQTGDQALGDGMNLALQISLEQTPYLYLLGGDKVRETLRALHLDENSKVTPSTAMRVCQKTNSRAVISAFVADVGNRFRVDLTATDCQSGRTLGHVANEAATRGDIVRTLGLSAFQLRRKLGESRDSLRKFNQPLDQATSSSPDALAFLAAGYKKQLSGDFPGALGEYERAREKDPHFALVYAAKGSVNLWLAKLDPGDFSKAFDLRSQLTMPARFQVETLYYGDARNDWIKDCAIGEEWVRTFPRDVIARINFGSCLMYLGRNDEAVLQYREAARLLPSNPTLSTLMLTAILAQKLDEAKQAYEDAISRGLGSPWLHLNHALLAFLQSDASEMQKEWAWASQDLVRGRYVLSMEANTDTFHGRFRDADRLARIAAESSLKAGLTSDAALFEETSALRDAEIGSAERVRLLVADALGKNQDRENVIFAAFALARAGNTAQAQKLAESISQRFPRDFTVQAFLLPCVKAAIKLNEKDPSAALAILQPVEPYDFSFNDAFDYAYPAYLRGLAYLQLKQGRLAADQFRRVLAHPGIGKGFVTESLSRLELARALELAQDSGAARRAYEDFLTLWKDADPGIPVYRQAKAEYAELCTNLRRAD